MKAHLLKFSALVLALAALPLLTSASPHGHGRGHTGHGVGGHRIHSAPAPRVWHSDIRRFHGHDFNAWRGGGWRHANYGGRLGWWWVAGGAWYYYAQPVYPYPDPYASATIILHQPIDPVVAPVMAPLVVQQAAPAPIAAPASQVWYYCEPTATYYPYVASCDSPWKTVPATPPGATQNGVPQ